MANSKKATEIKCSYLKIFEHLVVS